MKKAVVFLLLCALFAAPAAPGRAAEPNRENWPVLRVEMYDREIEGFDVTDCWQLRYVQKHFGDPNGVRIEWTPVPRWTESEELKRLLEDGTAPDVCMSYSQETVNEAVAQGKALPLDRLLQEYGQDLAAFLGDEVLEYGQYDVGGSRTQYALPARRIIVATRSMFIREDWLARLGMDVPKDVHELYAYLKGAKEAELGGEKTIPFSIDLYAADPFYGWLFQIDAFLDYDQISPEDWTAYYRFHELLPGAKEAFRWLNRFYSEGLIDANFTSEDNEERTEDLYQGRVGLWIGNWDAPWRADMNYEAELEANIPSACWVACDPFKPTAGVTPHETYSAAGQAIFFPSWLDGETAATAMRYLNWMSRPETLFALQNGEQGHNYQLVSKEGVPLDSKSIDDTEDEYKIHVYDGAPICNGYFYGSDALNYAATSLNFPGYENAVSRSLAVSEEGGYAPVSFTRTIQARMDYGGAVVKQEAVFLQAVVSCDPSRFDQCWEENVAALLDAGARQIVDEQRQAYLAGEYRGQYPRPEEW